nr:hypothetical protein QOL21_07505 [Acholeplasma laidlawii]
MKINTENDFLFMNHNKNSNYEIRNDEGYIDLYYLSQNTEEPVTTISSDIFTEKNMIVVFKLYGWTKKPIMN